MGVVAAVEMGFMSTSSVVTKPLEYMDRDGMNVLWALKPMQETDDAYHTGANIALLSQFAEEEETLFPPCTMLVVRPQRLQARAANEDRSEKFSSTARFVEDNGGEGGAGKQRSSKVWFKEDRLVAAAKRVQARMRGRAARKKASAFRTQYQAAAYVQRLMRGKLGRRRAEEAREEAHAPPPVLLPPTPPSDDGELVRELTEPSESRRRPAALGWESSMESVSSSTGDASLDKHAMLTPRRKHHKKRAQDYATTGMFGGGSGVKLAFDEVLYTEMETADGKKFLHVEVLPSFV